MKDVFLFLLSNFVPEFLFALPSRFVAFPQYSFLSSRMPGSLVQALYWVCQCFDYKIFIFYYFLLFHQKVGQKPLQTTLFRENFSPAIQRPLYCIQFNLFPPSLCSISIDFSSPITFSPDRISVFPIFLLFYCRRLFRQSNLSSFSLDNYTNSLSVILPQESSLPIRSALFLSSLPKKHTHYGWKPFGKLQNWKKHSRCKRSFQYSTLQHHSSGWKRKKQYTEGRQ